MVTSTKKKHNPINHVSAYLCDWDNSLARIRRSCDIGFALYCRGVLWHRQWSGRRSARHCWPWRQIEQIVNDRHNKRSANSTCWLLQMTIDGVKHPFVFVLVPHTHHMSIDNRKKCCYCSLFHSLSPPFTLSLTPYFSPHILWLTHSHTSIQITHVRFCLKIFFKNVSFKMLLPEDALVLGIFGLRFLVWMLSFFIANGLGT